MQKNCQNDQKYNIGDVWWVHFPFGDTSEEKRRPAIVIDDETIAILAMYVTSKSKETPYSIEIEDWEATGLKKPSWARIDKIVKISEWNIDFKIGELSDCDRIKILQLTSEYLSDTCHEFSIVAIMNSDREYLQIYDERWSNWLFPYIASTDDNKSNVDDFVSDLLKMKVSTEYVSVAKHCKYSVSDQVYKIYNHKLYKLILDDSTRDSLSSIIKNAKWMSIEELELDSSIMEINDDVIAFVNANC